MPPTRKCPKASITRPAAPGEHVTIQFDIALTNPFPAGVSTVTNQGTLSASNLASIGTDDPATGSLGDATITAVEIPTPFLPLQVRSSSKTNGGPFQLSFTNAAGVSFTVLGSTNVALPLSNWTVLGVATEAPAGQFSFSDPQSITNQARFYRLRSP